jgi:hypothetical protein
MSRATPWLSPQTTQGQARAGRVWIRLAKQKSAERRLALTIRFTFRIARQPSTIRSRVWSQAMEAALKEAAAHPAYRTHGFLEDRPVRLADTRGWRSLPDGEDPEGLGADVQIELARRAPGYTIHHIVVDTDGRAKIFAQLDSFVNESRFRLDAAHRYGRLGSVMRPAIASSTLTVTLTRARSFPD